MKQEPTIKAERPVYSVEEAGQMAGLGKNAAYLAAQRGEIRTLKFGRKLRVARKAWDDIVAGSKPTKD